MKIIKILLFLLLILSVSSCRQVETPHIDVADLLLPETKVPSNWTTEYRDKEMIESAYQEEEANLGLFRAIDGISGRFSQEVLGYTTQKASDGMYGSFNDQYEDPSFSPKSIPNEFQSLSLHADKWTAFCYAYTENTISCVYIAKYSTYLVDIGTTISVEDKVFMNFSQFADIILEVDKNINNILSSGN